MINPQELAEAVAHWLRFEHLCRRNVLFTERHMAHAIGQYLLVAHDGLVEPEAPHPELERRSIDFAIRTEDRLRFQDVIETKLVTDQRDFREEIYRDMLRLELACPHLDGGAAWLLIAGLGEHLKTTMFADVCDPQPTSEQNFGEFVDITGDGSVLIVLPPVAGPPLEPAHFPFEGILAPIQADEPITVDIRGSKQPHLDYWRKGVSKCDKKGPAALVTHLQGRWIMDYAIGDEIWMCMVWRVSSTDPRVMLDANEFGARNGEEDEDNFD